MTIAYETYYKHGNIRTFSYCAECLSEAVKILKVEYLVTAIKEHKMDQAILFCRTKLDCDNVEQYLVSLGGGENALCNSGSTSDVLAVILFFSSSLIGEKVLVRGFNQSE